MKLKLKAHLRLAAEEGASTDWRDKYDSVRDLSEGLVVVQLNGKWGFVDVTGKEVVPVKYDHVWRFKEGLASVELKRKRGFVDKEGKEVVPPKYDSVRDLSEGLVGVQLNGQWGFIDKTGKEVIPLKYDSVGSFHEGLAVVLLNGQRGLVDKTGKELLPCVYNESELPVKTLEEAIKLSNRIKKKYEQDSEGLELTIPEVDWKSWYEQLEGQ